MPWGVAAAVAGAAIGGAIQSDSARSAANKQSDAANNASNAQLTATRETNQLQSGIYRQGLANSQPYTIAGQKGLSALLSGLGLGGATSSYGGATGSDGRMTTQPVTSGMSTAQAYQPTPGGGVQQILSGGSGTAASGAALSGAPGQQVQDENGNWVDPDIGHINVGASQGELDQAAGTIAPGSLLKTFTGDDLKAGIDPGYQFRTDQGNAALAAKRAATGNRFGSQALKDIANYNQDAASQEYGNAYNRYTTNRDSIYNKLAAIAGTAQAQTNTNNAAGAALGSSLASNTQTGVANSNNYLTSGAAAQAAGQIGSTNAIVGGLNTAANNWYQMQGRNNNSYDPSAGVSWTDNSVTSGGNTYYEG